MTACVRREYLESPEGGRAPVHGNLGQEPDEQLFATARRIHDRYGFINRALIEDDPEMPTIYRILKRYASLADFYEAAGLPMKMDYRRRPRPGVRHHV